MGKVYAEGDDPTFLAMPSIITAHVDELIHILN
jgi:hypothetical protein